MVERVGFPFAGWQTFSLKGTARGCREQEESNWRPRALLLLTSAWIRAVEAVHFYVGPSCFSLLLFCNTVGNTYRYHIL